MLSLRVLLMQDMLRVESVKNGKVRSNTRSRFDMLKQA